MTVCAHCDQSFEAGQPMLVAYAAKFDEDGVLIDGARDVAIGSHDEPSDPDRIEGSFHLGCHGEWIKEQYAASEWSADD